MEQPSFFGKTSIWTIAFSTIGGVAKAKASPVLLLEALTLDGSLTVISYAFMSAIVGYGTKKGLDFLFNKIRKR